MYFKVDNVDDVDDDDDDDDVDVDDDENDGMSISETHFGGYLYLVFFNFRPRCFGLLGLEYPAELLDGVWISRVLNHC